MNTVKISIQLHYNQNFNFYPTEIQFFVIKRSKFCVGKIAVYFVYPAKHVRKLCSQNSESLQFTAGGMYIYHWSLKC